MPNTNCQILYNNIGKVPARAGIVKMDTEDQEPIERWKDGL